MTKEDLKVCLDELAVHQKANLRTCGYDSPENQADLMRRIGSGRAMLERAIGPNPTLRDILTVTERRFAPFRAAIEKAVAEAPSVARFERIVTVLCDALLESAKTQDILYQLGGWFARGLALLAERPKRVAKTRRIEDLYFDARERRRICVAAAKYFCAEEACGREIDRLPLFSQGLQLTNELTARANDLAATLPQKATQMEKSVHMCQILFIPVRADSWRYDGSLFQCVMKMHGVDSLDLLNSPAPPGDEDPFLDFTLEEILNSSFGRDMGLAVLGSMRDARADAALGAAKVMEFTNRVLADDAYARLDKAPPPPVPKGRKVGYSKFAGQFVGRTAGRKFEVLTDGVTLRCPVRLKGESGWRSYRFYGVKQWAFLDKLLARYQADEAAGWYAPTAEERGWPGRFFKNGEARQFYHDGHIAHENDPQGGFTGRIKLQID